MRCKWGLKSSSTPCPAGHNSGPWSGCAHLRDTAAPSESLWAAHRPAVFLVAAAVPKAQGWSKVGCCPGAPRQPYLNLRAAVRWCLVQICTLGSHSHGGKGLERGSPSGGWPTPLQSFWCSVLDMPTKSTPTPQGPRSSSHFVFSQVPNPAFLSQLPTTDYV